jgi:hypothetical protein
VDQEEATASRGSDPSQRLVEQRVETVDLLQMVERLETFAGRPSPVAREERTTAL